MSEETRQRFKDAVWLKYTEPVTLIGAGGIGSWVALLLYKMGYKIEVYDSDNLEELNIGSQLYSLNNCNNSKLKALQALLLQRELVLLSRVSGLVAGKNRSLADHKQTGKRCLSQRHFPTFSSL